MPFSKTTRPHTRYTVGQAEHYVPVWSPLALAWKVLCSEQPEALSMAALPYASVLHIPILEPWTLTHTMAAMGPWCCHFTSFYTTTESEAIFKGGIVIVMPRLGRGNNEESQVGLRSQTTGLSSTDYCTTEVQWNIYLAFGLTPKTLGISWVIGISFIIQNQAPFDHRRVYANEVSQGGEGGGL